MIEVGIHDGISAEIYHRDELRPEPTLSRSGIQCILTSDNMADFAASHPRLRNPAWPPLKDEPSEAMKLGNVIHSSVLGVGVQSIVGNPGDFVIPSGKNKGRPYKTWTGLAKAWKEEQEANGYAVLDDTTNRLVTYLTEKMTESIVQRYGKSEWDGRRVEQTMIWAYVLRDGGVVYLRARPDVILPCGVLLDPKSTVWELSDDELGKSVGTGGLDLQCAVYQDGKKIIDDLPEVPKFEFVHIRTVAPYTIRWTDLDKTGWPLNVTRMRVEKAINIFGECLKSSVWPDLPIDASPIPPSWWQAMTESQVGLNGEIEA